MKKRFIILVIFVFTGCGTGEPISGRTNHIFKNSLPYSVDVIGYNGDNIAERFFLEENEEYVWMIGDRDGENNGPFSSALFRPHDSVLIIYSDSLVISFNMGNLEGNPMRIENYELIEGEKEPYIYLFEFTNEDYQRALDRGRIINN